MTRTQVLTRFAQHYPDCDATTAGLLFDETHLEILDELKLRKSTLAISLTAGTREYTLSLTALHIEEAYYQPSVTVTTWKKLVPVSTEQLSDRGNWRMQAQNQVPNQYYVSTAISGNTSVMVIGFDQLPPTTTSGSYPNVTLYGDFSADLIGSDSLPTAITYANVYAYTMCEKFAIIKQQDVQTISKWHSLAEKQMQANKASIREIQQGNEGIFIRPSFIDYTTRGY